MRNSLAARILTDGAGLIPVVAEPLKGFSDDALVDRLESCGALKVAILAPGYISARVPISSLDEIELIARVSLKRQMEQISQDL